MEKIKYTKVNGTEYILQAVAVAKFTNMKKKTSRKKRKKVTTMRSPKPYFAHSHCIIKQQYVTK